jgi:hypothetical protein
VVSPEVAGGKGFGDVTWIAGFTNGDIPRVASATPTSYLARAYLKNTWGLSPETEMVVGGANQLTGRRRRQNYGTVPTKVPTVARLGSTADRTSSYF